MKIKKIKNYFSIKVKIYDQIKYFKIKYKYKNYIKNILSTLAVFYILGKINNINKFFFRDNLIPSGRGNLLKIKFKNKKINLIDESYNSNPLSLSTAISNFSNSSIQDKKNIF